MSDRQESFNVLGTGEVPSGGETRRGIHRKSFLFGPYKIVAIVTEDGKLVGIAEVQVSKEFLSLEQRIASSGSYDVADLYEP